MNKMVKLQFPLSKEQVLDLDCGDLVYLSGCIHTMRDMGHRRALDLLERGEKLPFDLVNSAIWHCAPIVRKNSAGRWEAVSAGSTTSSRFTPLGSEMLEHLGMRCTLGKGTMNKRAIDTMKKVGSVFLSTTGGCAALYAQQIEEVLEVYWTDLGLPEAIWVLKVKEMGPLVVAIDAHGNSLYEMKKVRMQELIAEQCDKLGVRLNYDYIYMPKRVPGRPYK